jgi:predicted ATPase
LLRVEGMLLTYHPDQTQNAEQRLVEAFEISKRQESVAWQLRCATSLARLMIRQNRSSDARALLTPILRGFSEGFDTADLRSAQRLLAATDSQASDGSR